MTMGSAAATIHYHVPEATASERGSRGRNVHCGIRGRGRAVVAFDGVARRTAESLPVIGSVLALGLGLLVRSFGISDWVPLLYVAGVWLVIQIIDGFVLGPRAAGRVGVNPFLSILITLAGGFLFGPIGMLLAVPVVAIILAVRRARRSPLPDPQNESVAPESQCCYRRNNKPLADHGLET